MDDNDDLKRVEGAIEKAEGRVDSEIADESARIKAESEKLKKEEEKLKGLEAQKEKLGELEHKEKTKITEVEIQINIDSFKRFAGLLYSIFIEKRVLFYLILILAVIIGVVIHSASLPALGATPVIGNNYLGMGGSLTGLDPYIFYIEMNNVIYTGNVPAVEHLEYLPIGLPTRSDELLISFFGAFTYRFLQPFVPKALPMTWFMLYPVFAALLATIVLFFIALYLFGDYRIASLSALFLPVFQTFLSRTNAGFSTKTAMGYMFILFTILMLIKAVKSKSTKSKIMYGFMVMLGTAFTGISSGYFKYLAFLVPLVYIVMILMDYDKKSDLLAFLPFGFYIAIRASFVAVNLSALISNPMYYPMYLAYVMVLFKLFVYDKYHNKLKIPLLNKGISIALYSIIIMIVLIAASGIQRLKHIFSYIISEFYHPLGVGVISLVSLTIAEFGRMTLLQRVCEYGGLTGSCGAASTIGINFLLLYAAGIFLLYFFTRRFKHWYVFFLLTLPFIILLTGGTYTPSASSYTFIALFMAASLIPLVRWFVYDKKERKVLSTIVILTLISLVFIIVFSSLNQTSNMYKYGALGIVVVLILMFAFDKIVESDVENILYIIPFILFVFTIFFSNIETRLLEPTDIMAAIIIPFAIVFIAKFLVHNSSRFFKQSKSSVMIITAVIVIAAVVLVAIDLNTSLNYSYTVAQQSGSGLALWGPSLLWINQNTPVNSSVIAWWDYGYWIEAIANRTSVADGSNAYGYQSMIAKYFFEATSPYQYATYLNFIHRPTYALISGSEIEKFSAISTIAENFTQFAPMIESKSEANTNNLGNGSYKYVAVFGGSSSLGVAPIEASMVVGGVVWNASDTLLVEVLIPFNSSNGNVTVGHPYGEIYNELTQQAAGPLPIANYCVYGQGCTKESTNSSVIPGGVLILTSATNATLHIGGYAQAPGGYISEPLSLNAYGNAPGLLFIPNKNLNTLFVKLYLLNETIPGFSLVFTDGLPVNSLLSIQNQVLTNVNVYKINYTQLKQYILTQQCSVSPSAINYCDNLTCLRAVYSNNSNLLAKNLIP